MMSSADISFVLRKSADVLFEFFLTKMGIGIQTKVAIEEGKDLAWQTTIDSK
jgi:hypothetical protein